MQNLASCRRPTFQKVPDMARILTDFSQSKNCILSKLDNDKHERLRSRLQPLDLELKQVIYEPDQPIRFAYFPEQGMISVVSTMQDGSSIEIGTIGREGMAGAVLLLETDSVPYQHFVQLPGYGYRVEATVLLEEVDRNADLRKLILRYQTAFLTQSMQGLACNGLHSIQKRCCRWLLMARDRADSDDLRLTHEFLALMLGVRRASVSDVLRPLQEQGLVRSNHGTISILDRQALEAGACECYAVIANKQQQLLSC
jgi:CRP-like cAMP-binding protein